ncbi:MAG: DUF5615 family PIN-like protein [Opitutaceae bacterium]|nr:DUF5615 family PIN-like protein [Opitutaceae bacterium]
MKLIIDENLPPRWCEYFSQSDIHATHWNNIGRNGDPDEVIFDYAYKHAAVIITQDLDFTRLLALRGSRLPSVIQLRVPCPVPEYIGSIVLQILKKHGEQLHAGCLISLESNRYRIRLLPLY